MRTLLIVALLAAPGCNKRTEPRAVKVQAQANSSAGSSAKKLAVPDADPRPVHACLESVEGLTEPQRSAAADQLAIDHRDLFAAEGSRTGAQLERACAHGLALYELALRHAVHEHRELRGSGRDDDEAWIELDRRWKALASRGVQLLDTCRETVPGSDEIGRGLELALRAQVGAERTALAEATLRRLLRYYPERVDAIKACFDPAKLAALREEVKVADPNPLTAEPWPTKVAACDAEREARLCTLRGRLPRDEAEAMALLDEPPKNMVDPADCRKRHAETRAVLGNKSWCYEPLEAASAHAADVDAKTSAQ